MTASTLTDGGGGAGNVQGNGRSHLPPSSPHASSFSSFAVLLYVSVVIFVALYAFTSGFFLTRYQLPDSSTCEPLPHPSAIATIASTSHSYTPPPASTQPFDTPSNSASDSSPSTGCWLPSTYSHAIVLLIDALRYNFTQQLPIISSTLLDSPHSTLLFPFIADAPTVTLQRLSALTTGSLPTFIDFAANFQSSELQGDSIVRQMQHSRTRAAAAGGVRTAFMGDDTWMNLFPSSIDESYPYPSFNVKDLHTVDNGCIQHLMPTLHRRRAEADSNTTQRSVTIAHFLGVDHVGHRYHATHETMADKLRQLNGVVAEVVGWMDERPDIPTVLFVLGDHGMTEDGNHGGATPLETNSALFIHTSAPFLDSMARAALSSLFPRSTAGATAASRAVQQIDFVPTLSLLLGLPIPFGSLGSVLPEMFVSQPAVSGGSGGWSRNPSLRVLMSAHYANAYQVWRYLSIYQRMAGTFDDGRMRQLGETFVRAAAQHAQLLSSGARTDVESELETVRLYRRYLDDSLAMCRAKWATFNLTLMLLGIVLLVAATVAIALLLFDGLLPVGSMMMQAAVGALAGAALSPLLSLLLLDVSWRNSLLLVSSFGSLVAVILRLSPSVKRVVVGSRISGWKLSEWVSALSLLCYLQGLFTNSYIIAEHDVVYFLAMSILLASVASASNQASEDRPWWYAVVAVIALRLTCELGEVLPSSSLSPTFYSPVELVCIVTSLFLLPPLLRQLYPPSLSLSRSIISYYVFPLACLLCLLYWSLQSASSSDSIHLPLLSPALAAIGLSGLDGYAIRIVLPHLVYASSYVGLAVLLCVGPRRKRGTTSSASSSSSVSTARTTTYSSTASSALHHRKQNIPRPANLDAQSVPTTIAAVGTPSAISPPWFPLDAFTLLLPTLLLVLGPKSAVLFLLVLLIEWCHPWRRRVAGGGGGEWNGFSHLIFLFCLSLHLFFRTSHSQSFSSLQIAASFIGFDTFYFVPAGLLLALNTFCHLLVLAFLSSIGGSGSSDSVSGGSGSMELLLVFCVRCVCTLCNAVVNRRHLMVWEIFAPKFVFDALSLVVWCVISVAFAAMRWRMRE